MVEELNIVPKEEVLGELRRHYSEEEIEVIFAYHTNHPIERDKNDILRWVEMFEWEKTPGKDPNTINMKWQTGELTQEEYMAYNRDIGYSLYGFWEVMYFNDKFDKIQFDKDMNEKRRVDRNEKLKDILEE